MNDHFIRNIEIKNYKLFHDFKAEGFGRVNLIGGKNNVGKTAFMEALFLTTANSIKTFYSKLLEIKTHRDIINNLLSKNDREEDIKELILSSLNINIWRKEFIIDEEHDDEYYCGHTWIRKSDNSGILISVHTFNIDKNSFATTNLLDARKVLEESIDNTKINFSIGFISQYSNSNKELDNIIGDLKLNKRYAKFKSYLKEIFDIDDIDTIKNSPMLFVNNEYIELSQFGQGIKSFINYIGSLSLLKDTQLFIDEIENGIHYTNFDKLWEIILTLSKEQNVQVFATTHSKECIESYARVAKKLEDENIRFISLYKDDDNAVKSIVFDRQEIETRLELGLDNR